MPEPTVPDAVPDATVEAAVVDRAFLRVSGTDAERYLQGQLSQDVTSGGGLSFLLDPTGKVVAFLRFGRVGGDFLLDTDPASGDAVLARLTRFLLRTDASVEPDDTHRLVRVFGGPARPEALLVTAWAPVGAVQDVLVPAGGVDEELAALGATRIDDEEYQRRRIVAGVPLSGVDIDGGTIPAEAGRWTIEAGVSFTKGCYTGQELVARIDSRGGNVPRPLRVLRFDGPVAAGADVLDEAGERVGAITSTARGYAMAPIGRRVEVGQRVSAGGTGGVVER